MYFLSRDVIRYTIPPSHEKEFYNRFTFIKTEIVIGTTPIPAFLPLDGYVIIGISKKKMSPKYVKSNLFRIDMNISRPSGFISRWSFFIYTQPQNRQKGGYAIRNDRLLPYSDCTGKHRLGIQILLRPL